MLYVASLQRATGAPEYALGPRSTPGEDRIAAWRARTQTTKKSRNSSSPSRSPKPATTSKSSCVTPKSTAPFTAPGAPPTLHRRRPTAEIPAPAFPNVAPRRRTNAASMSYPLPRCLPVTAEAEPETKSLALVAPASCRLSGTSRHTQNCEGQPKPHRTAIARLKNYEVSRHRKIEILQRT